MECTGDADRKNDVKQTTHFEKNEQLRFITCQKCQI